MKVKTIFLQKMSKFALATSVGFFSVGLTGCTMIDDSNKENFGVFINHNDKDDNLDGADAYAVGGNHIIEYDSNSTSPKAFNIIDYSAYVDDSGNVIHADYSDILPKDDTPYGILLTLNTTNYIDNYMIIKDLKNMFEVRQPKLPIMLNIDNLDYSIDTISLIDQVVNLLENNGCYVAISGTDVDLNKLTDVYNSINYSERLNEIDKMVIDTNSDKYDGIYTMVQDSNGRINEVSDFSHEKLIEEKDFNDPVKFSDDVNYIVKNGDTLSQIAQAYNISVQDIISYNNNHGGEYIDNPNKIKMNQTIIIPSATNSNSLKANETYVKKINNDSDNYTVISTSEILKGMDVSHYQTINENNLFDKKKTINFIYISYGDLSANYRDNKYNDYIQMSERNNIPNAIYYLPKINNSTTDVDVLSETQEIINDLDNKAEAGINMELPIGIDIEQGRYNAERSKFNKYVPFIAQTLLKNGYYPIVYSSQSAAKDLYQSAINTYGANCDFCKVPLWLAGGTYYNSSLNYNAASYTPAEDLEFLKWFKDNNIDVAIRQITEYGNVNGIGLSEHVDIDMMLDTSIKDVSQRGCNLGSSISKGKCK